VECSWEGLTDISLQCLRVRSLGLEQSRSTGLCLEMDYRRPCHCSGQRSNARVERAWIRRSMLFHGHDRGGQGGLLPAKAMSQRFGGMPRPMIVRMGYELRAKTHDTHARGG
jgi:hypothetical protein